MKPFKQVYWGWIRGEDTPETLSYTFDIFDPTWPTMKAAMACARRAPDGSASVRQAKITVTIEIEDTTDTATKRKAVTA